MPLSLSDADEERIANVLFFLNGPSTKLPRPVNTQGGSSLEPKLNPIAADPKFNDLGIGVVDFTGGVTTPRVWLHNEPLSWRVASTGKITILLAALQLRDDVRKVKATGLISSAPDFDELFATIWKRSKDTKIQEIADKRGSPRISTIFDLTKSPIDFFGADVTIDRSKLSDVGDAHLQWKDAKNFTFWERMWLTGTQSDDVAASTCVSEIGVAYMKQVQRDYGLFDPPNGLNLLLSSGYGAPPKDIPVNKSAGAPTFRAFRNKEEHRVKDIYAGSYMSNQPGSAAALTAFMIALMQGKLVDAAACDALKANLADENPSTLTGTTTTSLIMEGVNEVSTVTKAHTKLGILGSLRCEFAYIEAAGLKYAVMAMGILPKRVGSTNINEERRGKDLGKAVHVALSTP